MTRRKLSDLVYQVDEMRMYVGGKWLGKVPLDRVTEPHEFTTWRDQLEERGAQQVSPRRQDDEAPETDEPYIWLDAEGKGGGYVIAVWVGRRLELVTVPGLPDLVRLLTELRASGLIS